MCFSSSVNFVCGTKTSDVVACWHAGYALRSGHLSLLAYPKLLEHSNAICGYDIGMRLDSAPQVLGWVDHSANRRYSDTTSNPIRSYTGLPIEVACRVATRRPRSRPARTAASVRAAPIPRRR